MGRSEGVGRAAAPSLVLVVGDVMNDVVVRPMGEFSPATDTASEIVWSPGGSGANQAAWLGYLAGRARFAGRAGRSDVAAHRSALAGLGVDGRIAEDDRLPTGTVVVLVSPDGERSMFTDRGANARLCVDDLDPERLLNGVGLVHISGYALFEEAGRAGVGRLLSAATEAAVAISVDPASTAGLRHVGVQAFLRWTATAELTFPNLDEGALLTGHSDPDRIVDALLERYPVVALKLGPSGCLVAGRGGERLGLVGTDHAGVGVDSTGAGDAYCAGFLARWVERATLAECAAAAMAAAGEAVRTLGARPATQAGGAAP